MSYFQAAIDSRREAVIKTAIAYLEPKKDQFDAIAFTGISGAVIAPIIAYLLDKDILAVRKTTPEDRHAEPAHSSRFVEGETRRGVRVLLVDDFISCGVTANKMKVQLLKHMPHLQVVAIYTYLAGYYGTAPQFFEENMKNRERALGIRLWCAQSYLK